MKTRAKKSSFKGASAADPPNSKAHIKTLETPVSRPPHVFILPEQLSPAARIIIHPNPATSAPCRYLICPERGCYEFTRVAAPRQACKSWLVAPSGPDQEVESMGKSQEAEQGYVLQTPDLMIATLLDPLFLVLPALTQDAEDGGRQFYLPLSDYLDRLGESSPHIREVMKSDGEERLQRLLENKMASVCSSMSDGTENLYMLSIQKLLEVIFQKAEKLVHNGLPQSMEDKFVKQPLAVPISSIQREDTEISVIESTRDEDSPEAEADTTSTTALSQDTEASTTTISTTSTIATSVSTGSDPPSPAQSILHLLRLRTAFGFILQSYIPKSMHATLNNSLANSDSLANFRPLEEHLDGLEQRRKQALALRSLSDNISRKRSAMEDDETIERAEAKKRKKEEEDLKKKNTSRGVKQLAKADVSGMKTLSSFFGKAVAKKP